MPVISFSPGAAMTTREPAKPRRSSVSATRAASSALTGSPGAVRLIDVAAATRHPPEAVVGSSCTALIRRAPMSRPIAVRDCLRLENIP
jgi:hypothetical protein